MTTNRKTLKAFERDNAAFITGSTTINHKIRQSNNLSLSEYVILDTVMKIRETGQRKKPITYGDFWVNSGIKPDTLVKRLAVLKQKGWVFKDDQGLLQVAEKFKAEFKTGTNFEEFWKIAPKGGKAAALKMYDKAVRIVKHEILCQKYREYIEFCDRENRFKKDTSTWLNPTSGFIDSEWVEEKKKQVETENLHAGAQDEDFFNQK